MESKSEGNRHFVAIGDRRGDGETERAEVVGDLDLTEKRVVRRRMQQQRQHTAVLVHGLDAKGTPPDDAVDGRGVLDVVDLGLGRSIRERPGAVTDSIGPRVEQLAAGAGRDLFAGESLDDGDPALHEGTQCGADLGDDRALVAVRDGNLFTGGEHQCSFLVFTACLLYTYDAADEEE